MCPNNYMNMCFSKCMPTEKYDAPIKLFTPSVSHYIFITL